MNWYPGFTGAPRLGLEDPGLEDEYLSLLVSRKLYLRLAFVPGLPDGAEVSVIGEYRARLRLAGTVLHEFPEVLQGLLARGDFLLPGCLIQFADAPFAGRVQCSFGCLGGPANMAGSAWAATLPISLFSPRVGSGSSTPWLLIILSSRTIRRSSGSTWDSVWRSGSGPSIFSRSPPDSFPAD